ncbi:MAG: sigma 54-interacting transcriptional regulator [Proteobacteria bacterium]|nr:sigma 54-interacting transcriptional regulator [Pseudomonadota bacterium]MBU1687380.1 sigma 54-interacting transcriptional regulator [Pseudomonadota bacterium]
MAVVVAPLEGSGGILTLSDVTTTLQNQEILESVPDGIFTVDRQWRITSFNQAAEQITGWPREEALGRPCSEIFQADICKDQCTVAHCLYTGKPVTGNSTILHRKDGTTLPLSISASPLVDQEGTIIGGVETFHDLSDVTMLNRRPNRRNYGEIISKSPAMQRIFEILPEIAASESNVLILGESGTGKELVARATHQSSPRCKGPFITVNCGALPATLLESELFGYKAGAFTDAKHDRPGRFAAAEKGTIFLDEIGDIPGSLQVKLLRVLQERVYEPLGSNHPVTANVRIIAATNRDLQNLVQEGLFRDDLYYRLNVVKILLPPLRDRQEDLPMLCDHFVKNFSTRQQKEIVGISEEALNILTQHNFPGNIRELENIIEYAFILCHGGYIQPEHLPEPFAPRKKSAGASSGTGAKTLEEIEKQAILASLERNQWKRLATCRELNISKDTLRRKISRYELEDESDFTTDDD